MQSEQYKNSLKETLKNLVKVNESIFDTMVFVETQGNLKEWGSTVPMGEVHQFDFELFKNSTDTNVQLLAKLIESVDETFQSIKNINGIEIFEEEEEGNE